jgi:plasmid stabilization system protein ParE
MEERISRKPYDVSNQFYSSRAQIFEYSSEVFGCFQAEKYDQKIEKLISSLSDYFTFYPECRHLPTKSRMYRNIILGAHLIIYRITNERIEVLDIIHSASSISRIRQTRNIRI